MTTELSHVWADELRDVRSWSVLIVLDGRTLLSRDVDRRYCGASMIKTFVALVLARAVESGSLSWDSPCPVAEHQRASGDGVLAGFALPTTLPVGDATHLMLAVSDNTATNALVEVLGGVAAVNDALAGVGFASRLRRSVGGREVDPRADSWTADPGLCNASGLSVVLPHEHAAAMRTVLNSDRVRSMLLAQADRRALARYVTAKAEFAHKTGTIDGVRHDGGVLTGPAGERLEITVFTDDDPRPESVDDHACVSMGRALAGTLQRLGWSSLLAR